MKETGIYREDVGRTAVLRLHNPDRLNAFNQAMWESFTKVIEDLEKRTPRVIVVTGSGDKAFSAGFDVNPDNPQVGGLVDAVMKHDSEPVRQLVEVIRGTTDRFVSLPVPIIAAINGLAYGGGAELSSRCDLRIIDPDAVVNFSEVRLGLIPDWGGGVGLTRAVGMARAAEMILTARNFTAQQMLEMGFVNSISAPGKCLEVALELASDIERNGPRAVRAALKVIRNTPDLPVNEALYLESEEATELIASGECVHGITAFMNKKEPEFPDIE